MGNTRTWTRDFINLNRELEAGLKAAGITKRKRPEHIQRAAAGRDPNLPQLAREALRNRMVKHDIERIAGDRG